MCPKISDVLQAAVLKFTVKLQRENADTIYIKEWSHLGNLRATQANRALLIW